MTQSIKLDLTQKNDVVTLMKSSKNEDEWNANADKVKDANDGYPHFWYSAIVLSGVSAEVARGWKWSAEEILQREG